MREQSHEASDATHGTLGSRPGPDDRGVGHGRAGTIVDFSYSGRGGPDFAGLISTGAGSFSFAGGLSFVGLKDLTSFTFTLNENTPDTTTFGLSDLTSFSASVGPGPSLASLALATNTVQGSNQETEPREFIVSSLSSGGAATDYYFFFQSFSLTSGTVTINSVTTAPEPSTFSLAGFGTLSVAAGCRCRRKACADFLTGRHRCALIGYQKVRQNRASLLNRNRRLSRRPTNPRRRGPG